MKENNNNLKKISFIIILIGDSQVGKTCFYKKITKGTFTAKNVSTIGIDNCKVSRTIKVHEDPFNESSPEIEVEFNIEFYDTAGQERFRSITASYYKNSHGLILLYDITNRQSFENYETWLDSIKENLGKAENKENAKKRYSVILLGNKIDLEDRRVVSSDEAIEVCKNNNVGWGGECSIKEMTNEELNDKFNELIKQVYKDIGDPGLNKAMTAKKISNAEKVKQKKNNNQICCV